MLSQYGRYLQEAKVKIRIRTILDETKKKLDDYHRVLHVYLSVLCAHSQYLPAQSNVNLLDLLLGISTSNQGCHFLRWILKGHLKMLPILWASYPLTGRCRAQSPWVQKPSHLYSWTRIYQILRRSQREHLSLNSGSRGTSNSALWLWARPWCTLKVLKSIFPHSASNFEWCGPSSLPKLQLFCSF